MCCFYPSHHKYFHYYEYYFLFQQTWNKLRLFPQTFQVQGDEPAERSSAVMFFTIQHKVVLYKHLLVCLATKHKRQSQ